MCEHFLKEVDFSAVKNMSSLTLSSLGVCASEAAMACMVFIALGSFTSSIIEMAKEGEKLFGELSLPDKYHSIVSGLAQGVCLADSKDLSECHEVMLLVSQKLGGFLRERLRR